MTIWKLTALAIGLSALPAWHLAVADGPEPPGTQVWLISTRSADACQPDRDETPLGYWMHSESRQWHATTRDEFHASDSPGVPTIFYVHGNRVDWQESVNRGWLVCQLVKGQSRGQPFRFVIWSWPADEVQGQLRDVRVKAARADFESYYLASVLDRIHPDVPLTLIGFSFGARPITGAMHLLAGGDLAGVRLDARAEAAGRRVRAMLLAAAADSDWMLPGHEHGIALTQLEKVFLTVNCSDRVLKRYHWLYRCSDPQALGWAGPACPSCLGPWLAKLEMSDVSGSVGRQHDFYRYMQSRAVVSRLGWYSFLAEPGPEIPAVEPPPAPGS
jgi:hypothetical protein